KRLVAHAFANCPYYREEWRRQRLDPAALRTRTDFREWPLIDRETILRHRPRMRAQVPAPRLMQKSTGGSTGTPLHFDLDPDSHDRRTAAWHRGYGWAGGGPGAKELYLWGVPLGKQSLRRRCKDWLYHRLYRRLVLNSFGLREDL